MDNLYQEDGITPLLIESGLNLTDEAGNAYYTTNYCPNPSFELNLNGYLPVHGAALLRDGSQGWSGHASMSVETPGSVAGEGVSGPEITVPVTATGSISFYVMGGAGVILNAYAVQQNNASATIIASQNVILNGGDYQRVTLTGLPLVAGDTLWFVVQTTIATEIQFWIDAVQYETTSPAHAYIDGSFRTCQWEGFANESASFQPFQFGISATGGMFLDGHVTPVVEGEAFPISASGAMLLSGTESGTVDVAPTGALAAFGIWTPADMDPAISYAGYSNALTSSGYTGWSQLYGMFSAPQQYTASGGQVLWKRAAFGAVGFIFKAVPTTVQQSLAKVQAELMPVLAGVTPGPTGWVQPRNISTVVKPTRLNFCPNPSIESTTAGWTTIGTAVLSQDATPANIPQGSYALKVAVHASGDGCYIVISDLIIGDTYIASAMVQGGPGLQDVTMAISGGSASSAQHGVPYGGNAILGIGYGQGPYGGLEATGADMPTGTWFQPVTTFTARQSTVVLSFQPVVGSDVVYPTEFWVDAVLVEAGETLRPYFDGGFGVGPESDYLWESGGMANLSRSYYYERREVCAGAVTEVLAQHTPLGISAGTPVYAQPYTQ